MFLIAVSGGMGSGKTVLCKQLSNATKAPIVSFGGYFRNVAKENGINCDRASLQALGHKMINDVGVESIFMEMMATSHASKADAVIVDGIRQEIYYRRLVNCVGRGILIFADCKIEERVARVVQRDGISADDVLSTLLHETETDIDALRNNADIIINTNTALRNNHCFDDFLNLIIGERHEQKRVDHI